MIFIGKKLKIKEMDCKKAEAQLRNRCDPKNKWSKKGSHPGNKKAAMLGLAHEVNQKLIGKKYIKKAKFVENRIGPG